MALLRDQQRACLAYEKVAEVDVGVRDSYRIAVQDLGTNLRRMGLAASVSMLERRSDPAGRLLLGHIAAARIRGLGDDARHLPSCARKLDDVSSYMLATRELLRLAAWFNRAVQATFTEGEADGHEEFGDAG